MRRRFSWIALGLAASMFLAACSQTAPATPAPSQPSQSATPAPKPKEVKKIKVANAVTPPNMVHIPMYVALEHGFFKEEALEAEIISLEGGVGTARAIASKAVDFAGTSADPLIAQAAAGGQVVGVYSYAPRVTNAMISAPAVKKVSDLKGKTVGVQEKNGFADIQTRVVLATNGIKESEVTFVSTSTAGRLPNLLEGKTNSAILHVDQVYKALETNPDLNYLVKLWEADPLWWYSAYIVHKDTVKNDPEMIERFVRAIVKTTRWMYKPENKDKVVATYLKYNQGFSKEIGEKTYDDLVRGKQWPINEGVSREIVEHTIKKQIELGILQTQTPPKYEDVYDTTFINKVLQELGKQGNDL